MLMSDPYLDEAAVKLGGEVIAIGYEFTEERFVSCRDIAHFARTCGDENPLHYDEEFAQKTRFEGIIASGPHIMCFFTSMVATHFSRLSMPMIGLDFSFKFLAPVRPETTIAMQWRVVGLESSVKLRGVLAQLEGTVSCHGQSLIGGRGIILLADPL